MRLVFLLICLCTPLLEAAPEKELLVIGCGRSGTTYISRVLQDSGLDAPHEWMGRDGLVCWYMAENWASYGEKAPSNWTFKHTFHQVRDPLDTITSLYWSFTEESWDFIEMNLPQIAHNDPLLVKAAKYWYYWNWKCQLMAEWTYKVEDLDQNWDEFCFRLGRKLERDTAVPKNTNTWNMVQHKFTWKELEEALDPSLLNNIRLMALGYSYPIVDH